MGVAKSNFKSGHAKAFVSHTLGFELGFEEGFERTVYESIGTAKSDFECGQAKFDFRSGRAKAVIT